MSVCLFSADELGQFVATATQLQLLPFADAVAMAETISRGNAAAYAHTYHEFQPHESADEIERAALDLLSRHQFVGHFGPLTYNMIANDGTAFLGELNVGNTPSAEILAEFELISDVEKRCRAHAEAESRRIARQTEDDAAFADVGPLPKMTRDELTAEMERRGASAVIVAECRVDESDMQTDYHGGRTARSVVIGFRTGKRESFKQLRTAAGEFPPTAEYGPGRDVWTARVVFVNDVTNNGNAYWNGSYSHWHEDIGSGKTFQMEAEALEHVKKAGDPHDIGFPGTTGKFRWDVSKESVEHRENYSMGGGNYLGHGRHGGWIVRSQTYLPESVEVFEPPKTVKPRHTERLAPVAAEPLPVVPALAEQYAANV